MTKPPEIPESIKAPSLRIFIGLRKEFPTVPEERFKDIVSKELAAAAIEAATKKPEDMKGMADELAERLRRRLRRELS